ncbi:MAG TPA: TlpA disulfide reductase family protein [Candidatus Eisenbacteria bacterium]
MTAVGERAPEFGLPILAGGFRSLPDLVEPGGGVLVFFKTECATSELVVPRLAPLARALEAEERLFLAVAQDDPATARAFARAHGIAFPLATEAAPYAVSSAYGVATVPTLFVIDGAGVVAERVEGFVKSEYLALGPALERALALGDVPPVLERPDELPGVKPG